MDRSEEHGCRGGGAIGAEFSWQPLLRAASVFADDADEEEEEEDEGAGVSASAGQGPVRQWFTPGTAAEFGMGMSGAMAPCGMSAAMACSASRVGEDGGEGRSFFLFDSSFNRPFFSLWSNKRVQEDARCWNVLKYEMFSNNLIVKQIRIRLFKLVLLFYT